MARRLPELATALFLVSAFLAGCAGPADAVSHRGADGAEDEAMAEPEEGLIPRQFVRGGRPGLETARAEGRGAMLLFAASW